jgi:elongation factor G
MMKAYETKNLRNLALLGHAGSGKTTLSEAMLFESGSITRRGLIEERNTVSDYYDYEHERGCSVFATPMFAEWKDVKFNIIDTPGYDDYIGEMVSAVRVVDMGVILVNALNGIEVGTENAWYYLERDSKPTMFVINKVDLDQSDFEKVFSDLKERYGNSVVLMQFPEGKGAASNKIVDVLRKKELEFSGSGEAKESPAAESELYNKYRTELIDAIAETDEDLMNKYFDSGDLSDEDLMLGLKKGIVSRQIFPVLVSSAKNNFGAVSLMNFFKDYCPSPADMPAPINVEGEEVNPDAKGAASVFVFKMLSEAHLGDMTFFKVMSGTVKSGIDMINEKKNGVERINQIFCVCGKKRVEADALYSGDIGATVKLKLTQTSHTLHDKSKPVAYPPIEYPNPKVRTAIAPKVKGEEEKVGMALNAIHNEDPTIVVVHSQELRQTIVKAQGELHLGSLKWRLLNKYKVETEFVEPKVPYRETIQKAVKGSYRHKKQSGGAGQFAEVHMLIEPWYENIPNPDGITVRGKEEINLEWGGKLVYLNCIVGGVIDQRFMPAILKGVMEKMQFGPLTGSYVRDIRVSIFDGKMHPVDSNEAAFKTASMMVFKDNFTQASPKILEPIYNVLILVPEEYVGDVMSDLPSRRGVILGIETEGRYQKIKARMPLAELDKYPTSLRSMTQGRASYQAEYAEYQATPPNVQQELIEAYKKHQSEDE